MSQTTDIIREIQKRPRTGDTLEDLGARDFDNLDHLLRHECKVHYFPNIAKCGQFMGEMLTKALKIVGVDMDLIVQRRLKTLPPSMYADFLENRAPRLADAVMRAQGVKVERRRYDDAEEAWKNGLYIMKRGEIAFVIGDSQRNVTAPEALRYSCRTNVPVEDDGGRIISVGQA